MHLAPSGTCDTNSPFRAANLTPAIFIPMPKLELALLAVRYLLVAGIPPNLPREGRRFQHETPDVPRKLPIPRIGGLRQRVLEPSPVLERLRSHRCEVTPAYRWTFPPQTALGSCNALP